MLHAGLMLVLWLLLLADRWEDGGRLHSPALFDSASCDNFLAKHMLSNINISPTTCILRKPFMYISDVFYHMRA